MGFIDSEEINFYSRFFGKFVFIFTKCPALYVKCKDTKKEKKKKKFQSWKYNGNFNKIHVTLVERENKLICLWMCDLSSFVAI